jgi:hypothetical protein
MGLRDFEALHCLDNRFTDGGEVVSLKHRQPVNPQEKSWYSFLLEAVRVDSIAIVWLEKLSHLKNPMTGIQNTFLNRS